jgi:hypothetical protein
MKVTTAPEPSPFRHFFARQGALEPPSDPSQKIFFKENTL